MKRSTHGSAMLTARPATRAAPAPTAWPLGQMPQRPRTGWLANLDSGAANSKAARIQTKPEPGPNPLFRQLARALLFSRRTRLGLHPERSAAAGAFFRTCPAPRRTPFWPPPVLWKTPSNFTPDLIATKPVKPCDAGVFWAFYLLLIRERQAAKRPAFRPSRHPTQTRPE